MAAGQIVGEARRRSAQAAGLALDRRADELARGGGARRPVEARRPDAATGSALAARLDETSYFQTPDWVLSWWETIAGATADARGGVARGLDGPARGARRLEPRSRAACTGGFRSRLPVYVNAGSGAGAADHCGWLVAAGLARRGRRVARRSAIGGAGLLLRSADAAASGPPLPPARGWSRRTRVPAHAVPPPDQHGGTLSHAFDRQLERFTRRMEREGVLLRVGRGRLGRRAAACAPCSTCTRERVHAMASAPRSAPSSFALHRRLAERSAPRRGPLGHRRAMRRRRRRSPLRVPLEGHLRRLPVGMGGEMGPSQHGQCARLPGHSPRRGSTARARSTSCAAPSRTSTASAPSTGGIGRGCAARLAARCAVDIERATGSSVGRRRACARPRTAARRGPPDARP